jgi:hypothetical protein
MACTKQTYTATATWTASELAGLFEDAFIDAGLMTAWYDSFLSGTIENRVLEVTYDGTKTYGKTYYWFMFATTGVWLHVATGWNNSTNVPSGTQYLDFFSTTTNATTNHWQMFAAATTNTVELVRYTSGVDADQSWFTIKRSGGVDRTFTIVNGALTVQPWLDLDKGFFSGFYDVAPTTANARLGQIAFQRGPTLRRDLLVGVGLNASTSAAEYNSASWPTNRNILAYSVPGRSTNGLSNNYLTSSASIILPTALSSVNPAYTADSNPVFHGLPFNPYVAESLPSDFGLTFHYASNAFNPGDTLVVTAGTEEWEVLDSVANTAETGATPIFLARMV